MSPVLIGAWLAGILPEGMLDSTVNVLVVILGVGFLIFVHELGHFAVAKWSGVRVDAFSIGFGPCLKYKRGETEYRLSLIPLGGYVKMAGEGQPVEGEEHDPRELRAKSGLARAAIFSAGVIMNGIAGMALFAFVFAVGVDLVSPVVGAVVPGSSAWDAGLEPGDRILDVDGHRPIDFIDMASEMAYIGENRDMRVRYERDGETREVTLRASRGDRYLVPDVGIDLTGRGQPISGKIRVKAGGAAEKAGLRNGDVVFGVDGQKSDNPSYVRDLIESAIGPVDISVRRDGKIVTATVTPTVANNRKLIGITQSDLEILSVLDGSPAAAAGFKTGDRFLRVGDRDTPTFREFTRALRTRAPPVADLPVLVRRGGAEVELRVGFADIRERRRLLGGLSTMSSEDTRLAYVDEHILPLNPVKAAGIPQGARILEVNGESVKSWGDVVTAIAATEDAPVRLTWQVEDGEARTSGPIEKVASRPPDPGLSWTLAKDKVREDVGTAIVVGFERSVLMGKRVIQTIGGIFSGSISGKALGGPIAIFKTANIHAEQSFMELLMFLGLLSVNLAIINLLPIPILDGGHLLFLLIEKIKGSPVRESTLALAQWVGLILILALLVYVTFNDILRLV